MNHRNKKILIIGSNEHFTLEMMYYRALRNENNSVDLLSMEKILSLDFILKIKYIFPFPFFILNRKCGCNNRCNIINKRNFKKCFTNC